MLPTGHVPQGLLIALGLAAGVIALVVSTRKPAVDTAPRPVDIPGGNPQPPAAPLPIPPPATAPLPLPVPPPAVTPLPTVRVLRMTQAYQRPPDVVTSVLAPNGLLQAGTTRELLGIEGAWIRIAHEGGVAYVSADDVTTTPAPATGMFFFSTATPLRGRVFPTPLRARARFGGV